MQPSTKRLFLSSSSAVSAERDALQRVVEAWNDDARGGRDAIEWVRWEDASADRSPLPAQAIDGCDLFVVLLAGRISPYVEEEFALALNSFQKTGRPTILVFLAESIGEGADKEERYRFSRFEKELQGRGLPYAAYTGIEDLMERFHRQLEALAKAGFFASAVVPQGGDGDAPAAAEKAAAQAEPPPAAFDPLLLAWWLVLDFKAEPELLLHLDAAVFRTAVDKLASEARFPQGAAWPEKFALAQRHLESRHGAEKPNPLWLAWVNNLQAFKISALIQAPDAVSSAARAASEIDDPAWVQGERAVAAEGEPDEKVRRPQHKK